MSNPHLKELIIEIYVLFLSFVLKSTPKTQDTKAGNNTNPIAN